MECHIKRISSWLKDGSKHTADVLTIWGMGGIGKTSLAKYVYELHRHAYTSYSFIEDISRRCTGTHGLLKLQKQLYGDISKRKLTRVHNVSEYTSIICKALAHEEVLVILDDIDSYDQLDQLLGDKGFHPGSKIIITTKDASLIERCALFKTKGKPKHTECILEGLSVSDSMELLCHHAFICNYPREGYEEVAEKLVRYCEGHPLALEVLGKSLHKRDVAYWEERIKGLKKEPLSGIEKVKKALQLSFDSLSSENDKELFKHIACFFVGEDRELTETVLEACDINTTSGITNLMEKCFLRIGWDNELWMHSLIQEMGRDLVRQESLNKPWERSRLWCHEESFDVLKRKKGTENILGLALDMGMLDKTKLRGSFELKTESFSQMNNLMLLQLNNVQLNECFHNFPEELRWLCMHGFPLKAMHLNKPMENLVALDMSYSNIESFDMSYSDPQPPAKKQKLVGSCSKDEPLLGSLKILNLSFCEQLHSVGGFFELPALEKLIVKRCISLMEVCESVEQCVELVHIDLSYCYKLKRLPISLDNNLSNESFPMDLSCLVMLEELSLNENPIVSLPICVGTLPRIQKLSMDFCDDVISVEHLPRTLRVFSMYTEDKDAKIRKIKFDPEMAPLKFEFLPTVEASHWSFEYEGIIKIEPMADVEEKLLHSLGWNKSDFFKEGRLETHDNQMYYEFGIFSAVYKGKGIPQWIRCRSEGPSISFIIPSSPKKLRGLNFCCVNWPLSSIYNPMPKIKISNITKKQTWIYKHYFEVSMGRRKDSISCLSHWMFGPNEMKAGDNIIIQCFCDMNAKYKMECGVGVVYNDGSMEEEEEEEDVLSYYKSWNHIIGGDLSAFQLTTGEYYITGILHGIPMTKLMILCLMTKAAIWAQCSQTRPTAMPPAEAPCMPMFPHGLGQQTFDGQPQLTLIPPQHQLVPGMSSPTCQQEAGGSRVGVPGPQNHQPLSLMQQQMVPFGLMYSHPPGSDAGNVLMASVPYDVEKAMHLRDAGGIFALTNASPTEQWTMSGEDQYPPLEQLEAESEATVTTDFLRLLESPEARKAKVAEAMEIEQGSPAHELASFLSL
ncbi:putative polyadenylate-binding protein/Hyperplastic disc protein [Helianthus annuus]|nr:putative polyadenylate-binding protein/Hyperplastic disc protein [Helianthus annuus]